jgi:hypothetical protein
VVPLPWVAEVSLPGLARAWAISSATVLAGTLLGLTTSAFGTMPITETATKAEGSKPSFE